MKSYLAKASLPIVIAATIAGSTVAASSIAQTFRTATPLASGTVVSLDTINNTVRPASTTNEPSLLGVIISEADSTLSIGDPTTSALVARTGSATAIVSDINGAIKAGDKITASPLEGIGMKALTAGQIVGTAEGSMVEGFTQTVKDKRGRAHQVKIGRVSLVLSVGPYSPTTGTKSNYVPSSLRVIANGIAGKDVAAWRILSSVSLIALSLIIVITFVYSSIQNSLTAIGRNPLSAPSIYRNVVTLLGITMAILVATLVASYALVKF